MDTKKDIDQSVNVDFESHPPIDEDLDGITALLRQSLLHYADCHSLAEYLIKLKDVTQVIALVSPEDENTSEDDEPDNDIYGVSSIVELPLPGDSDDSPHKDARKQLMKFLRDKCPALKQIIEERGDKKMKIAMIINERYINLPAQLSLPMLKNLIKNLDESRYTHLVFVSKILLQSRDPDTKLKSKKSKLGQSSAQDTEPLVYVNPEEEIICEGSSLYTDLDVSSHCDENASWSFGSDIKYAPHRRIMLVEYSKWPEIMGNLERELKC